MNIDQVLKHADENSKFLKIGNGETVEGYFQGEITSKEFVDKITGKSNVAYAVDFVKDGVAKEMTVSAGFLRQCRAAAEIDGVTFETAIFKIRRDGIGQQTRWTIRARAKSSNPVTQIKEVFGGEQVEDHIPDVPF